MAPKVAAPKRGGPPQKTKKDQGKPAEEKKKAQANMLGQLKNARLALAKAQAKQASGEPVDENVIAQLQAKVDFETCYKKLGSDTQKKAEMLAEWQADKACKRWNKTVTQSLEKKEYESTGGAQGWCSRHLPFFLQRQRRQGSY